MNITKTQKDAIKNYLKDIFEPLKIEDVYSTEALNDLYTVIPPALSHISGVKKLYDITYCLSYHPGRSILSSTIGNKNKSMFALANLFFAIDEEKKLTKEYLWACSIVDKLKEYFNKENKT